MGDKIIKKSRIGCKKCGHKAKLTSRYCEKCGNPLFVLFYSPRSKKEKFIDVFNSIYSLLRDRSAPERQNFFSSLSEQMLWQRSCKLYENYVKNVPLLRTKLGLNPYNFDLNPLYQSSASTAILGYSSRTAEELHTGKISKMLDLAEIDQIITKYINEGKREHGDGFLWGKQDVEDSYTKRIVFCEALRTGNLYEKFSLFDKEEIQSWKDVILKDNIDTNLKLREEALSKIYGSLLTARKMISDKQEQFAVDIEQDFIFGYCLRLNESLMPFGTELSQ